MYVKFKDCIGGRLRGLCDRLTPRQRAIVVIVMVSLFALVNFYMIFRAIYDIGREDARQDIIRITPLEVPDFVPADTLYDMKVREMEEFFNQFNKEDYEYRCRKIETEAENQEISGFHRYVPAVPRVHVANFRPV